MADLLFDWLIDWLGWKGLGLSVVSVTETVSLLRVYNDILGNFSSFASLTNIMKSINQIYYY